MFSTFTILIIIYFIIPPRCTCIPIPNDKTTTLNFKEKVEQELDPLKDELKKMIDPLTNSNEKIELKGQLQGEIKKIIERAIRAETENKILIKDQGGLEMEKDNADMYQLLLALTFRVDTLEKLLAPGEEFKAQQRSKRWIYIFTKNTPTVENLRNKVHAAGMTVVSFAEQVERLIQERNNLAGHANIPLPRLIKEKTIEGALEIMEITDDDKAVETLKILVAPVKGLYLTTAQKS